MLATCLDCFKVCNLSLFVFKELTKILVALSRIKEREKEFGKKMTVVLRRSLDHTIVFHNPYYCSLYSPYTLERYSWSQVVGSIWFLIIWGNLVDSILLCFMPLKEVKPLERGSTLVMGVCFLPLTEAYTHNMVYFSL